MHHFKRLSKIGASGPDPSLNVSQLLAEIPSCFKCKALKQSIWAVAAFVLMLIAIPSLHAQVTASLSGTVLDKLGAVIPGAKVTAIKQATQDKTNTVTSQEGTYNFPLLLPGVYTLRVEAAGFAASEQMGITVNATEHLKAPDVVLTVGKTSETITVEETNQVIQTDNGQRGAVLDSKDIQQLALGSRNLEELLKVLPGVTSTASGTSNGLGFNFFNIGVEGSPIGVGLAINGAPYRGGTSNLSDGVNINDPGCNCWSIATMNPDWTEQVVISSTNFGADVSHGPVVVNNISKSGGAKYHGEAYLFARNDVLNANDWVSNNAGKPRGNAHYYYPGGNVGGLVPFTHKSLFFWFGYEKIIQNTGNASQLTSYIPTADMMSGNFTATAANSALCPNGFSNTITGTYCNDLTGTYLPDGSQVGVGANPAGHIPAAFLTSAAGVDAQALAKIWPKANATPTKDNSYANFFLNIPGVHDGYEWRARADYNFGDRTKIYVAYQFGTDNQVASGAGAHIYWTPGNSIPFPGGSLQSPSTSKILSGHFVHVFSDTLTNEFVASVGYANNPVSAPNVKAVYKTTLGYTGGTVFNTGDLWIPSYNSPRNQTFPDFSQQDIFSGADYPLKKEAPSVYDNVIKSWNAHTLKFGAFYEMVNNDQGNFNTPNGVLSFDGAVRTEAVSGNTVGSPNNPLANFVMGNATSYSENSANPRGDMAYKTISVYADDSWRATKRLSIELGFRFDHAGRWYDRGTTGVPVFLPTRVANDFAAGKTNPGLWYHAIDPGISKSGAPTRFLNVSPRFGLSYDLFGNGKTVARGGWGEYIFGDQWGDFSGGLSNAQGVGGYSLPGGNSVLLDEIGSHSGVLTPSAAGSGTVYAVNPDDMNVPKTYGYNFTISQQMPWRSLLEVAYVGNEAANQLLGGGNGATIGGDFINLNKMPLGALFAADPITGVVAPNPEKPNGPGSPNNKTADYRPYGYAYGDNNINVVNHGGYSNYNGVQVSWVKRSDHLTFNLNYTHSKVLSTNLVINPFSLRGNYGVNGIDRPNVINLSYSYNVGRSYHGDSKLISGAINDWLISGITTWQGGGNLQAINNPNFGMSLSYTGTLPAGVDSGYGGATYYGTNAKIAITPVTTCNPGSGLAAKQHVREGCFAPPAIGTWGPRNYVYLAGPSYTDADLTLAKKFHLSESHTVEFRASIFDWLNHPLATFNSNQLSLAYTTDYASKLSTVNDSSHAPGLPFGYTSGHVGGDTRRIVALSLKYAF